MKTKILFFYLSLIVAVSASAQTANYYDNGVYFGTPVTSINVDFSTLGATDFTWSTSIQETKNVGFVKFLTTSRNFPGVGGTPTVTLFNNNNANGQEANSISPAYIYLPKMAEGIGQIKVQASRTGAGASDIPIEYSEDNGESWKYLASPKFALGLSGNDDVPVMDYNLNKIVQLRFKYTQTSYIMFKTIKVSKFGQTINDITTVEQVFDVEKRAVLIQNRLKIKELPADVYFYSFSGQLLFSSTAVIGDIQLPNGAGIVQIVQNDFTASLKKLN